MNGEMFYTGKSAEVQIRRLAFDSTEEAKSAALILARNEVYLASARWRGNRAV